MARILTDGYETGISKLSIVGGGMSSNTSVVRSGAASLLVQGFDGYTQYAIGTQTEVYLRVGIYLTGAGATTGSPIVTLVKDSTEIAGMYFRTTPDDKFLLYDTVGNTVLVVGPAFEQSRWYLLELHYKLHASTGLVEGKVDGASFSSGYSGNTDFGGHGSFNTLRFRAPGNMLVYYDDLAVNDTTGGADNSWVGDGHIILLKPNTNGDSSQWVGSDGNSTDNYLLVDDLGYSNDGDTTYVESATSGHKDLYNVEASGLDPTADITRVWTVAWARETVALGESVEVGLKAGATESWSTAVPTLPTSYGVVEGDYLTTNPDTTVAWEPADLADLQVGIRVP